MHQQQTGSNYVRKKIRRDPDVSKFELYREKYAYHINPISSSVEVGCFRCEFGIQNNISFVDDKV
ncbi:hypothetical protein [Xenorhabdus anantnagensis]|uniref:Uncharacterized protein n=1 Tax=Xenorhabdus anantnagensis TaxID=3025875 RepID=A0ABT5LLN9_9GAMM|nr:hypothetical protein [Xenorhabdus anantnagensis]MDC9595314.1 hypothetical protein [Xenorhabdus anantnagensis]